MYKCSAVHTTSGAAQRGAEQSGAARSGNSEVFFAARGERSSTAPPLDQHGQEGIFKGELLFLSPKLKDLYQIEHISGTI